MGARFFPPGGTHRFHGRCGRLPLQTPGKDPRRSGALLGVLGSLISKFVFMRVIRVSVFIPIMGPASRWLCGSFGLQGSGSICGGWVCGPADPLGWKPRLGTSQKAHAAFGFHLPRAGGDTGAACPNQDCIAVQLNFGTSAGRAGSPRPAAIANSSVLIYHDGAHGVTRPT